MCMASVDHCSKQYEINVLCSLGPGTHTTYFVNGSRTQQQHMHTTNI